jgi:hypothetical protein
MLFNRDRLAAPEGDSTGLMQNKGIKKGNPSVFERLPFSGLISLLNGFYIYSMRAFGPLFYVKRNLIAFVERPESF